jgi:hypothetical protein
MFQKKRNYKLKLDYLIFKKMTQLQLKKDIPNSIKKNSLRQRENLE